MAAKLLDYSLHMAIKNMIEYKYKLSHGMHDSELSTHRLKNFIVNCSRLEENACWQLCKLQRSPLIETQFASLDFGLRPITCRKWGHKVDAMLSMVNL